MDAKYAWMDPCPVCNGQCPSKTCRRLPWWPWVGFDGRPYVPETEREYVAAILLSEDRLEVRS
jgi:hypothetical protein